MRTEGPISQNVRFRPQNEPKLVQNGVTLESHPLFIISLPRSFSLSLFAFTFAFAYAVAFEIAIACALALACAFACAIALALVLSSAL